MLMDSAIFALLEAPLSAAQIALASKMEFAWRMCAKLTTNAMTLHFTAMSVTDQANAAQNHAQKILSAIRLTSATLILATHAT